MICYKNRFPLNLFLLFGFTLAMSFLIGITTTAYAAAGLQVLVVEAFAITSLLFIGLTLFTMQSKIDFSFLSFAFRQVYALVGTVIFSLYVLYDTHAITTYLSFDDYVLGAINLYLDFINLFTFILQLLTTGRRD